MSGRVASALFALLCTGGASAAVVLAVHEATQQAPVAARVVTTARHGLTTVAQVEVRSRMSQARCVQVRAVAQDRDGRDLGASEARRVALAPHGRTRFSTDLALTARQYAEQLVRVRAVLASCPAERPVQK